MEKMGKDIRDLTKNLRELYPETGMNGSRASLYGEGSRDKIITNEEYNSARKYYGRLWSYTGD